VTAVAVARFGSVFGAGLASGVLLGDRMGASFARPELPASSFVTFQQIVHRHFVVMMPILLGITILSCAAWLILVRSRTGSAEFAFLALGALAFVSIAILTRSINVPINDQLMTWKPSSPPPDVLNTWARWERTHTARTVMAVPGFVLLLLAFAAAKNRRKA
jgi:uncharacterized membrane protein